MLVKLPFQCVEPPEAGASAASAFEAACAGSNCWSARCSVYMEREMPTPTVLMFEFSGAC